MTLPTTETARSTDDEIIDSISTSYDFGWHDSDEAGENAKRGLDEQVVREISAIKEEPEWMLAKRLKAYSTFERKPMPTWGVDLSQLDMDAVKYYVRSTDRPANSWEDLPEDIKNTYDRIGIPEAERERLVAGVAAQYESEVVYHQIRGDLEEQGVIFVDTDTAVREYPELVKEYFGTVVPAGDNKFAALNTAVWSGGSFIYVPKGVHVEIPLQAYFRINTENMGQFERTLIIADEDSYVHYVEGNIGSKRNMKYPAVFLMGPHARGEALSIAFAGADQHQDTGAKMVHMAPHTSSHIVSKSIARHGGRSAYRGLVQIMKNARHSKSNVLCDALLVDEISRSDTYPYVDVRTDDVEMGHEATVSKVSADQLFYLMQRGLTETEAMATIVRGFVEPIARELPMEYALELNRLIELQMENSVG